MLSIDCGDVISVLEFSSDSSKLFIQGHTQVRNPLDGKLIGGPIAEGVLNQLVRLIQIVIAIDDDVRKTPDCAS
jgi:hypothetical protein